MNKNYIAHHAVLNETEFFETEEEAIFRLAEWHDEERAEEGYSHESCDGKDYIAKITHRSKYIETDNIKKYKWDEEEQEYIDDGGNIWNYLDEFDSIGEVIIEKINPGKNEQT